MAAQGARCAANRGKRCRIRPSKMIKRGNRQVRAPRDLDRVANSQIQFPSLDQVWGINKYRQKSTPYRERAPLGISRTTRHKVPETSSTWPLIRATHLFWVNWTEAEACLISNLEKHFKIKVITIITLMLQRRWM